MFKIISSVRYNELLEDSKKYKSYLTEERRALQKIAIDAKSELFDREEKLLAEIDLLKLRLNGHARIALSNIDAKFIREECPDLLFKLFEAKK